MTKKKKFKGNNAKLDGETRLTHREMKKLRAVFFNVSRDNASRLEEHAKAQIAAGMVDIGGVAQLGSIDG